MAYRIDPEVAAARGRVGALARARDNDDPDLKAARADLARARAAASVDDLERHVREVVAAAPPLTPEQRDRIASILHSVPA